MIKKTKKVSVMENPMFGQAYQNAMSEKKGVNQAKDILSSRMNGKKNPKVAKLIQEEKAIEKKTKKKGKKEIMLENEISQMTGMKYKGAR